MLQPQAKTVLSATIRVTGTLYSRVDLHHADTADRTLGITLGDAVCYIRQRETLDALHRLWETSQVAALNLPPHVEHVVPSDEPGAYPVGLTVRLDGLPPRTSAYVPECPATKTPAHLRAQFGPLVWQITDQVAFASMAALWKRAERLLNTVTA